VRFECDLQVIRGGSDIVDGGGDEFESIISPDEE
jgi:hypothetical protein